MRAIQITYLRICKLVEIYFELSKDIKWQVVEPSEIINPVSFLCWK